MPAGQDNPDRGQLRRFGLTMAAAFGLLLIVILPFGMGADTTVAGVVLALAFVLPAMLTPMWLGPVFHGWMKFAELVNRITSPLILGLIFYALIVPFGVVRRILSRNNPSIGGIDRAARSYRVANESGRQPDHMKRTF